jgi:hypothetical protein
MNVTVMKAKMPMAQRWDAGRFGLRESVMCVAG